MSVTFFVPTAVVTTRRVPCDYGFGEPYSCKPGNRCGYCQDGWEEIQECDAPDLNVANVTAGILLGLMGLVSEPGGSIPVGRIPAVRRRIVLALSTTRPEAEALPESTYGGPGTGKARVIDGGIDADRIRDRLAKIDAILAYAQSRGQEVSWG